MIVQNPAVAFTEGEKMKKSKKIPKFLKERIRKDWVKRLFPR